MKINVEQEANQVTVKIEGIVKSIVDSQNIQDALNALSPENHIVIDIVDSFSLTSTIIGFLLKKVNQDKFNIQLRIRNKRLWDLLEHLSLTTPLNARLWE